MNEILLAVIPVVVLGILIREDVVNVVVEEKLKRIKLLLLIFLKELTQVIDKELLVKEILEVMEEKMVTYILNLIQT